MASYQSAVQFSSKVEPDLSRITSDIVGPVESRAGVLWWAAFLVSLGMFVGGCVAVAYLVRTGVGTWGVNNTVGWGFGITNFVFWIGIGHAGTFISAILFLLRQSWRTSVGRIAETTTILAILCAAVFPLIHLGRPWLGFWMLPYPNFRGPLWINFRSPLVWDFFAIGTYFIVSLFFWYLGLLPDLATLRDRLKGSLKGKLSRVLSLGWNGSTANWDQYSKLYALLAGLATALVISVHSIVSFDFAVSIVPGWHTSIFPPYFVTGAIFSGLGMVLCLVLIARRLMNLESLVPLKHLESLCKVILVTSGIIGLAYAIEVFHAFYSGDPVELLAQAVRMKGPMRSFFIGMVVCNVLVPQLFWLRRIRTNWMAAFAIAVGINVGMWLERYVIVVGSLYGDFLPSSWAEYAPTWIEIATLLGSVGLFGTGFLLCCRLFPMITISEVKVGESWRDHA